MALEGLASLVPRQPWRLGFGQLSWRPEDRAYAALLEALTRERQAVLALQRELLAPARALRHGEISAEQERGARAEVARFRAALEDARARAGRDGQQDVVYDSSDPRQDRWVETLIQYLVRPGYAEVRTEEPEPWHYRYALRIDWERLRQLVTREGTRLPL